MLPEYRNILTTISFILNGCSHIYPCATLVDHIKDNLGHFDSYSMVNVHWEANEVLHCVSNFVSLTLYRCNIFSEVFSSVVTFF